VQSKYRNLLGSPNEKLYTADDIERCLSDLTVEFRREEHQTKVIIPEESSREFRWLVSFFLQTSDDALTESDWTELKSFFRPFGREFRHDVNFFWIHPHNLSAR
jgi:hypothetical protein